MKSMTCKQLGGACEHVFKGETFEEIAEQSKKHGQEMAEKKDEEHLGAMKNMREMMKSPEDMQKWYKERKEEFDALSSD